MVVAMAVAMVDWNYETNDQGLRERRKIAVTGTGKE